MENIQIDTEFVTLGQLLKMTDAISSGGMARWFLSENDVLVNNEAEERRGRKLRNGDKVIIPGTGEFMILEKKNGE
ncbi:MAG: S4 domain-containing protein YaaA [Paenisporosarcina sp.]